MEAEYTYALIILAKRFKKVTVVQALCKHYMHLPLTGPLKTDTNPVKVVTNPAHGGVWT